MGWQWQLKNKRQRGTRRAATRRQSPIPTA